MSVSSRENSCPISRAICVLSAILALCCWPVRRSPRGQRTGRLPHGGPPHPRQELLRLSWPGRGAASQGAAGRPPGVRDEGDGGRDAGDRPGRPRRQRDGRPDPRGGRLAPDASQEGGGAPLRGGGRPDQAMDRQGSPYAEHWAFLRPRTVRSPRSGRGAHMAAERDQLVDPRPTGAGRARAIAGGRPLHAPEAREPRPARAPSHAERNRGLRRRPLPGRLRKGRRPVPGRPQLMASGRGGCGSTSPATPTRPDSAPTPSGPTSGVIATGSSTPSTATSPTTGSPWSRSPATCCLGLRWKRGWRPLSTATR